MKLPANWATVDTELRPLMSDAQWAVFKSATAPLGYDWGYRRVLSAIAKAKAADAANKTPRLRS